MAQQTRNVPSFSNVTSTFRTYIKSLPLLTTSIAALTMFLYALDALLLSKTEPVVYNALALLPEKFFKWQVHRLFTYPYPHLSLGHLLLNLLVFVPLSTAIEHTIGTLEYAYVLTTIFTVLSGAIYLAVTLVFSYNSDVAVGGLSAWIFGVVVWESRELAGRERDIFGLFRIPSHFYPLVLLLLMEILIKTSWFAAHLCGLFVGYLYAFGYLTRIMPSSNFYSRLESKSVFRWFASFRSFVKTEDGSRGGWWLLWNDDVLEDAIIPPGDGPSISEHDSAPRNETTNLTTENVPTPTVPLFSVTSSNASNASSRAASPTDENSPRPAVADVTKPVSAPTESPGTPSAALQQ